MSPAATPANPVPRHVAIIMDGNGRWAGARGLPRLKGHEEGAKSVRAVIRACRDLGIEVLTLYAFSVENWVRPRLEINGLMRLLSRTLREQEREFHEQEIRLRTIGRIADLPASLQRELARVEAATAGYTRGQLVLALSYGGRTEIAHAARAIARRVAAGTLDPEAVDEALVARHLYAPDLPDPDLLIRTSGELRVSNFLLWQCSYAEFYVTDLHWPDFREDALRVAVEAYQARHRRFGGVE